MIKRISRLFFGGEEETPMEQKTPKLGETVEDEWFLVSLPDAVCEVNIVEQPVELAFTSIYRCPSIPHVTEESKANLETNVRIPEPDVPVQKSRTPSRVICGSVHQAGPLAKVTQVARVQRAQAHSDRRHLGRSGIHRQNCIRQRSQRHTSRSHTTYLHQPGHRNLSH